MEVSSTSMKVGSITETAISQGLQSGHQWCIVCPDGDRADTLAVGGGIRQI
jgi:hypothetical protein